MTAIHGENEYRYTISNSWAKVPPGMEWSEVAAVAVDHRDQVYVFNRGPHPMMVFDRLGNFLQSWGEDYFVRAHGAHIGDDGFLYLTDDGRHTVSKCTLDGHIELTLGIPESAAPFMSLMPFNRCTHTALSPNGEIYVSDGYGNACIHKYAPNGKRLFSWGSRVPDLGSSTCPTISAAMQMVGFMSRTEKAIEYRSLTRTESSRPNGPMSTDRAACSCPALAVLSVMLASWGRS